MGLLDGKVAIVTGGANGIGAATVNLFVRAGANVVIADIQPERETAEALVAELGKDRVCYMPGDVANKRDTDEMVAKAVEQFGRLDCVVNNAGITRDGFMVRIKDGEKKEMSEEAWDAVLTVNLKGTWLVAQSAAAHFIESQTAGTIVSTASVAARGNIGQANYAASKAGIIGMTRTLALELARYKVRVNCIAPGATATRMFDAVPDKVKDQVIASIPLKRMADPAEIAQVHLFLSSGLSSYVTGQCLYVDGGVTIGC